MELFKNLKFYLRRLGILPWSSNLKTKYLVLLWNCMFFGINACYFLTPLWFVLSTAQTFENYTKVSIFLLSSLLTTLWYSVCVWQKAEYQALFMELGETMEKRKQRNGIDRIYDEINGHIEKVSKNLHVLLASIVIPLVILFPIVFSLVKYISSNYSNESFQQIYPAKYPFDWKTPFGYALCALIQTATISASGEIFVSVLILIVGFCIFVTAFVSDIEENLRQLNYDAIAAHETKYLAKRKQVKMREKLFDIIEFHSESIRLTRRFSQMNNGLILAFFLYATISACSLFLQINMLLETGHFASIGHVGLMTVPVTFWLYLFCHFGDRVTECFGNVDRVFYEIAWYELPLNMQKCFPMAISLAQKEVYLQGFASINCTKESYKRIMKAILSYFMVLKEFTN